MLTPCRPRSNLQLNLPLLQFPPCVLPTDTQAALVLALVELLIGAVLEPAARPDGGDDEREAHR
jgi:hypothetical protein